MNELARNLAAAGGSLVALSGILLMLSIGRIASVSGILAGFFANARAGNAWRLAFVMGLIAAPLLSEQIGISLQQPAMPESWTVVVVAGLLVGFGARLGSGGIFGHGFCMAKRSWRSITATLIFMATAAAVVFAARHGIKF